MANNPQISGVQPPQPHLGGAMDPPRSFMPPIPAQFRPMALTQQSQQFMPVASPHFQPVGQVGTLNSAFLPSQPPQVQFPQPMQQLAARAGQPGLGPPPPPAVALTNAQPNMLVASGLSLPAPPSTYVPGLVGPRPPLSSSYTFAPSSYGQPPVAFNTATHYQPLSQMHASNVPFGGQLGLPSENQTTAPVTTLEHGSEQSSVATTNIQAIALQPKPIEDIQTDWKEHVSANGRRYYYNKRTKQSSWEKPLELMTPIERADASTDWKEFTSPDGRKYYYNKVTKQSKWEIPEELKLARERIDKASTVEVPSETIEDCHTQASVPQSVDKLPALADASSSANQAAPMSPDPVTPAAAAGNLDSQLASESTASPIVSSSATTKSEEVQAEVNPAATFCRSDEVSPVAVDAVVSSMNNSRNSSVQEILDSSDKIPAEDKEGTGKSMATGVKVNIAPLEGKSINQEPVTYADKQEARNAFKALLESANVGSDWTWEQAMRAIITDRRYGALKTLGERKQTFNEFLGQKKKQEVEERRIKQKKAREEFKRMLDESEELTSSTRWSKAIAIFENGERFKAVERERDRRDLFDAYLQELGEKERAKAQEERKRNIMEYRQFLESCDFIKASTQWRKVQERLEADERCSRLEKIDRVEIFQDYLHDLEKEEEEQRKLQKEEQRKVERKNRDDFRKLMEADVATSNLTAKTHWRDYYAKVKDLPAYLAVESNTSGSTPKHLFEDVAEELEKQYQADKTWIKDVLKLKKVVLTSTWTLEELKNAVAENTGSPPVSDVNLKIIFDELLERAKEKEEKEAKKRKRHSDEFFDLLNSIKEITSCSKWEDCKELFEESREFRSIGDESSCRGIFDEYLARLKEQAKETERKRKEEKEKKEKEREERERRKAKHKREKERGHEREEHVKKEEAEADVADTTGNDAYDDNKRRLSGESNRKHRRRHENATDDLNESEKDPSKSSHRHSSGHKKSKRHTSTPDSDGEGRHKKHKRDHQNGSRKNGDDEELEDGEFGEDGQTRSACEAADGRVIQCT